MAVAQGSIIDLTAERAVAGGRMLARHEGQVVLVAGAIPGERVRARVERTTKQVAWADTREVLEGSPDRREAAGDPRCGGAFYSHVKYPRQLLLKGEVIADAFRRIGRIALEQAVAVKASPERGYRLRARLHVREQRAGFFLEGSHALCDAAPTGQLHADALPAVHALLAILGDRAALLESVIVAENIDATARVLHLEPREGAELNDLVISLDALPHVAGVTAAGRRGTRVVVGCPTVTDTAGQLFGDDSPVDTATTWTRHAGSFFQANRFLVGALVRHVLGASEGDTCVDLYSGVGLFAVAMAARGSRVIAVEGDRVSAADLSANAEPWGERLHVTKAAVEEIVQGPLDARPDVVVLDPPRTGVSTEALGAITKWSAGRLVYVSCDPPTLARDAARIIAAGYTLQSVDAFDLFPNTPHVETVAVFQKSS